MERWPEAVERVAAYLRDAGAEARLEEFPAGTPTAADAARAAGCDLSQIVKSLVVECGGLGLLALVPGDRRGDLRKIERAAGCSGAAVASPARVLELTGFEAGAVAPFPLTMITRVLMERSLLTADVVWIGAGSPSHLASLPPHDLARLAHAEPVDLVTDHS